tara:strand:- start:7052 stop:7174 length:123 start_codon:yes stop_codon:yes gene_type:complete
MIRPTNGTCYQHILHIDIFLFDFKYKNGDYDGLLIGGIKK